MSRRSAAGAAAVLGGAAAAAATGGALAVDRLLRARAARAGDPYADEPFGLPVPERSMAAVADDGVVLPVDQDGPPDAALTVVLIHGYGLDRGTFHFQRRALRTEFADRLRLIQYDQRGHGDAGRGSPDRATAAQLGEDLAAVLSGAAATGHVMLVGHAMGGMAILALARAHPELFGDRVVAAALITTPLRGLPMVTRGLPAPVARSAALIGWLAARRMSLADRATSPAIADYLDGILARMSPATVAAFAPALARFDGSGARDALRRIQVAALAGREDRLVPIESAVELAQALTGSESHIFDDAGHVLMLERPGEVNGVLIEMVRENLVRRSAGRPS